MYGIIHEIDSSWHCWHVITMGSWKCRFGNWKVGDLQFCPATTWSIPQMVGFWGNLPHFGITTVWFCSMKIQEGRVARKSGDPSRNLIFYQIEFPLFQNLSSGSLHQKPTFFIQHPRYIWGCMWAKYVCFHKLGYPQIIHFSWVPL